MAKATAKKKAAPPKKKAASKKPETKKEKKATPIKKEEKPAKKTREVELNSGEKVNVPEKQAQAKVPGSITVEKVKLLKGGTEGAEVTLSIIEADGSTTSDQKNLSRPAHEDLKTAFSELRVHLGLMCGFISRKQLKDIRAYTEESISTFSVHGISIRNKGGNEGVTIIGANKPELGGRVGLNTPFTRFDEVEETRYRYMDDLLEKLEVIKDEVLQYVNGTKVGEAPQPELPFANAGEQVEEEEENNSGITKIPWENEEDETSHADDFDQQ